MLEYTHMFLGDEARHEPLREELIASTNYLVGVFFI